MNKVILMGRLTRDPDVRYSQRTDESIAVAHFILAVDRRRKNNAVDEQSADFIRCVAFRKTAEFAEKYLRQGIKIVVTGSIRTGNYTNKDGQRIYTTDVLVEELEFAESKSSAELRNPIHNEAEPAPVDENGFTDMPDDDLPFK